VQKINIVAVGKVKEKYFTEGINEYLKRLSRFAEVKIIEVKEEVCPKETDGEIKSVIKREGESILPLLKGYIIALCIEGKKLSSEDLSRKIKEIAVNGDSEITFVIGGSYGLSDAVKSKANYKLSFSDMTFPHTLMRLILTEQLYRAFMINGGSSYHK
jgi:23S rRNA (pseudouridine1915-N3)-methyltransferase